jgi:two-component system chemotaxis response regulator CheB
MKTQRDIIAIGASAGGVEALSTLIAGLPADLGAALLIVLHVGRASRGSLPRVLARAGKLPAEYARDGEPIEPGRIYIAPSDCHLLVEPPGRVRLSRGPREHFTRPAIDPLFRSAAAAYGPRIVGLVLSGMGRDGTAGLSAIRRAGGVALVQDPDDAICSRMPRSALEHVAVDAVAPSAALPALLVRLAAGEDVAAVAATRGASQRPRTIAGREGDSMAEADGDLERPAALTCPECGGAVREEGADGLTIYRCHIGHRFAADGLAAWQIQDLEHALSMALRVLNERAELSRRMAAQTRAAGHAYIAERWEKARREAEDRADTLRRFLEREWQQPEREEEFEPGGG